MSLLLVSILILVVALLFPLLFLFTRNQSHSKLPPGDLGFIRESRAYLNAVRRGFPEKFIQERMKKFSSPVFKTSMFGESCIVFGESTGNKFLFTNENKLVRASFPKSVTKIFPPSLSDSIQPIFRRMVLGFVKSEALQKYVATMDMVCKQQIIDYWENKKEVMAVSLVHKYTIALACKVFLNVEDPIQLAKFEHSYSQLSYGVVSVPINLPGTSFYKAVKASKVIKKDLAEIIKRRKIDLASKKVSVDQDILSYMLTPSTDDDSEECVNESEVAGKLASVLLAGDTSSYVLSVLIKYLAELPHIADNVFAEQVEILESKSAGEFLNWEDVQKMKYLWNVACEAMRLFSPSHGIFREAITDFTYEGYSIPKGWRLHLSMSATHKNPHYFPDPEKFDPSRFEGNGPAPYTFVPFGGGPRVCAGREFARLEICVFIHNLVTKFKWEKTISDEKIRYNPTLRLRPENCLPIRLHPRVC